MTRLIVVFALIAAASTASAQNRQKEQPDGTIAPSDAPSTMPPASPAAGSTWQADPKTGCKLWDEFPEPGESVSWSGGCKDGYADGHGVAQWSVNGRLTDRYEGDYRDGKENGNGAYRWKNSGDRYDGHYRDNQRDGQGIYTWSDGRRYSGMWKAGKADGQGRFITADGQVYDGIWAAGCFHEGDLRAHVGVTAEACGF